MKKPKDSRYDDADAHSRPLRAGSRSGQEAKRRPGKYRGNTPGSDQALLYQRPHSAGGVRRSHRRRRAKGRDLLLALSLARSLSWICVVEATRASSRISATQPDLHPDYWCTAPPHRDRLVLIRRCLCELPWESSEGCTWDVTLMVFPGEPGSTNNICKSVCREHFPGVYLLPRAN
jgi:hypothetical protein